MVEDSVATGGALRGALFWTLTPDGELTPTETGAIDAMGGAYGILPSEPLFARLGNLSRTLQVGTCAVPVFALKKIRSP